MIHELPLTEDTVHGYFSPALTPVLTIDPGDSVRFQSLNAAWRWEPDRKHFERDAANLEDVAIRNQPVGGRAHHRHAEWGTEVGVGIGAGRQR